MNRYKFISIEGNIGAGKTTLAKILADTTGAHLVLEEFEKNPFLPSFYEDAEKFALQTEMHFLHQRFRQLSDVFKEIARKPGPVVADYLLAKSLVFSPITLHGANLQLFNQYAGLLMEQVPFPDLVIYVHQHVEQLKRNIKGRGRIMEAGIEAEYLEKISARYLKYLRELEGPRIVLIDLTKYNTGNHVVNKDHLMQIIRSDWPIGVNEFSL